MSGYAATYTFKGRYAYVLGDSVDGAVDALSVAAARQGFELRKDVPTYGALVRDGHVLGSYNVIPATRGGGFKKAQCSSSPEKAKTTSISGGHASSVSAALNKELAGCRDVGFIVRRHPNGVRIITLPQYAEDVLIAVNRCGYGFERMVTTHGSALNYLITSRTR